MFLYDWNNCNIRVTMLTFMVTFFYFIYTLHCRNNKLIKITGKSIYEIVIIYTLPYILEYRDYLVFIYLTSFTLSHLQT